MQPPAYPILHNQTVVITLLLECTDAKYSCSAGSSFPSVEYFANMGQNTVIDIDIMAST